jgi:hypothetical protein
MLPQVELPSVGGPRRKIRRLVESPRADVAAEREGLRHLVAHKLVET